MGELRVFPDSKAVAREAVRLIAEAADSACRERGVFRLLLCGGASPKAVFHLLARGEGVPAVDWSRVQLYWGDERYVPYDHAESNFRAARDILISKVGVPEANIFPMPTAANDPDEDARRYQETLRESLRVEPGEWPEFDLALMGVGPDGHTASLFPGTPAVNERVLWVTSSKAPGGLPRITLTAPAFNQSRLAVFIAVGETKRAILQEVLAGAKTPEEVPAKLIHPRGGPPVFLVDVEARGPE